MPTTVDSDGGLSICGHEMDEMNCVELCDDFVSRQPGLCYLMAFDNSARFSVYRELGLFPRVLSFMQTYMHLAEHGVSHTVEVSKTTSREKTFHFSVYPSETEEKCISVYISCPTCGMLKYGSTNTLRPTRMTPCPNCDVFCDVHNIFSTKYNSWRIGSALQSVRELITGYPTAIEYSCPDPTIYYARDRLPKVDTSVHKEKDVDNSTNVSTDMDSVVIKIGQDSVTYPIHSQKLRSMCHNYVSSKWTDDSDEPLSRLGVEGPEGNLTPDFMIPETGTVLEVATCNTDDERAIMRAYRSKTTKYSGELKQLNVRFLILVVSPQKILTNCLITQENVEELTRRMRICKPLEDDISHAVGKDLFEDDLSETMRYVSHRIDCLQDYDYDLPDYNFSRKEIEEVNTPMTRSEVLDAFNILKSEWQGTSKLHSASKSDLDKYLAQFTSANTRTDSKRITNVPLIIPGDPISYMDSNITESTVLSKLWSSIPYSSTMISEQVTVEDTIENKEPQLRHLNKKMGTFCPTLDHMDKEWLALSGLGAKVFKEHNAIKEHRAESKRSFHPETFTGDINNFMEIDLLTYQKNVFITDNMTILVKSSKALSTNTISSMSVDEWNRINNTKLMNYCYAMNSAFLELSYTYKHWTNKGRFIHKKLANGIEMIVYNPKSSVFVSFAFPKYGSTIWDTGRLGPKVYTSSTHYFTDFGSYDNAQLEHFVKFAPYIGSLVAHLNSCSSGKIGEFSEYCTKAINHLLVMYCNNKTDCEELVTSQRYLFMKVLEDVGTSPYIFVDRLPKVMRSRLTVYYLKKTIDIMAFYDLQKIRKIPSQGEEMILYDYVNIKSLFYDKFVSLPMKINEFYFGYVIAKEINPTADKTFKVLTKLLTKEQKFRDTIKGSMFTRGTEKQEFKVNMPMIKYLTSSLKESLVSKFGDDFKTKLYNDYLHEASKVTFGELATLKVSARDHPDVVELPENIDVSMDLKKYLKEQYPEEMAKRPYCMEALTRLIAEYETETGKKIVHMVDLMEYSLHSLLSRGYFNSDQFNKDQHGGEREIHVLEMKARVVQFFLELVSRVICKYFESETTQNTKYKDRFVKEHYSKSEQALGKEFYTISKSADATTWCQYHHASNFAAMFSSILPEKLKKIVMPALSLWPRKRLSFPLEQAAILMNNATLTTDNKVFSRFKSEFLKGEGMFTSRATNTIEVKSGMFQGILHVTSSLYHTMIQVGMAKMTKVLLEKTLKLGKCVITHIEGSDDSGAMVSVQGKPSPKSMTTIKRALLWKERVSPYVSVVCNEPKSSIGTHDLIEYNSEWNSRHRVIKPTFRWISACMTMSVNERTIDRVRTFYNSITDCLTGGATTLECSIIQLYQASLHYTLMGANNPNPQANKYTDLLLKNPDPLFGFFPMDYDHCCGIPGVEFNLYCLAKFTNFGHKIKTAAMTDVEVDYSPEDLPSFMKTKDLSSVRLKFSDMKIFYRIVERMKIDSLENAVLRATEDPEIIFTKNNNWESEQINLILKVFSKGVRESISSRSSTLRMASASAYILTNRCFSENGSKEKSTLLSLMNKSIESITELIKTGAKKDMDMLFPFNKEFEGLHRDIISLSENSILTNQHINRTSKCIITIIPKAAEDIDVIEMCKRRWFNRGNVPLSKSQFHRKWTELVGKMPFISNASGVEGLKETAANLKMNVVQTKSFLESLSTRARSITLYDTASKSGSLKYSLSRIFWPEVKLINTETKDDSQLMVRCELFSVLSFWFTKQERERRVIKLITRNKELDKDWKAIHPKLRKLKIMKDSVNGVDKTTLLQRISDLKQGVLGSFTRPQGGIGKERRGTGIWQGTVCGISTYITMENNECQRIIISSLHDTVALGYNLYELVKSFKLSIYNGPEYKSGCNAWLTSAGKIVISNKPQGIPILQSQDMHFDIDDVLEKCQWIIDTNNQNVRLVAISTDRNYKLTMLSDTFTNTDWYPGTSVFELDSIYNRWLRGETCPITELQDALMSIVPMQRWKFSTYIKEIHNPMSKLTNNDMDWDMAKFQLLLRDMANFKRKEKPVGADDQDTESEVSSKDVQDIIGLVNSMLDDDDWDKELINWADEVEESTYSEDAISDTEERELLENIKLFTGDRDSEFFELVMRDDQGRSFKMPAMNRFFSSLDHLCNLMTGKTLSEMVKEDRQAPDMVGLLISLCTGVYRIGPWGTTHRLDLKLEEDIVTASEHISNPSAVTDLDDDTLKDLVEKLRLGHRSADEQISQRNMRLLSIYERILKDRSRARGELITDNIEEHSDKIVTILSKFLFKEGLIPIDLSPLDNTLRQQMLFTFLKSKITSDRRLTAAEKSEAVYLLNSDKMNSTLMQHISESLQINIILDGTSLEGTHPSSENRTMVLETKSLYDDN